MLSMDSPSIYEVPLQMYNEGLDKIVLEKFGIKNAPDPDLANWKSFLGRLYNPKDDVDIAVVGKYVELQDAYKSILESFVHAGAANEAKVHVHYVQADELADANLAGQLAPYDGILVAPGFGERGLEGKILACKYARENNVPFFGICLGLQMAVIEFARDVCGLKEAASTEMDPETPDPVIDLMEDQKSLTIKGGTMRLGAYKCHIDKGTQAYRIYGSQDISERHRHRYEFNDKYLDIIEKHADLYSCLRT